MKFFLNPNKQNIEIGVAVLEVILTLALLAMLFTGALALVFSNQFLIVDTENHQRALFVSESGKEELKAGGFNYIAPADQTMEGFNLHQQIDWVSDYAKLAVSKVSYSSNLQNKSLSLEALLFDKSAKKGMDTCSLFFFGDWNNPQNLSTLFTIPNTPITDVDVNNNFAYVSSNSSVQSAEDLFVFDVSSFSTPLALGKINTGPGLSSIHLAGSYVFAANDGVSEQLHIINVQNKNHLGPVVKIKVPKFNNTDSDGKGVSVYFYNNFLYLGLTRNNGPELHVYNVSNPSLPVWVGSYETDSEISGIYVFKNKAYLSLGRGKLLTELDVTNPSNIFEVRSFVPTGSTSQSGQSVFALGDKIFLGRAGGLPNLGYKEIYVMDKNNFSSPIAEFDLNSSVRSMFFRNNFLFLATNETGKELQIFRYNQNNLNYLSSISLPASANSLDCEKDNLFVGLENGNVEIVGPGN